MFFSYKQAHMLGVSFDMPVSPDGEYDICARYSKLHLIAFILVASFFLYVNTVYVISF